MGLLLAIIVVEEMPRDSRAYAVSLLALSTGLGAGIAVVSLPLADLGPRGWRLIYVIALIFLVVAWDLARRLPESRRFETPHAESPKLPRRRFALMAAAGFLLNLLIAPSSFFQNRYLKDVRGYSATTIALFTIVTNTPAGVGVVAGGRLADVHGRRIVGAVAVLGGAVFTVISFYVAGAPLWLANMIGSIVGGASVPALGVYTAELFPTGRRGLANGFIAASSLAGSSIGLLVAGALLDNGVGVRPRHDVAGDRSRARRRAGPAVVPRDGPPRARADQPGGPGGDHSTRSRRAGVLTGAPGGTRPPLRRPSRPPP